MIRIEIRIKNRIEKGIRIEIRVGATSRTIGHEHQTLKVLPIQCSIEKKILYGLKFQRSLIENEKGVELFPDKEGEGKKTLHP